MKKFESGKKWIQKFPFRCLVGVGSLLFLCDQGYGVERRLWIYDQLSLVPTSSGTRQVGYQSGASLLNLSDTVSTQLYLSWDAREFELTAKGSARVFAGWTERGQEQKSSFSSSEPVAGVELARRFTSRDGRFGRLGVEYHEFLNDDSKWIRIGIHTGILEKPDLPWLLRLSLNHFRPIFTEGRNTHYVASLEVGRILSQGESGITRLGGGVFWSYRTRDELNLKTLIGFPEKRFRSEHMLFSLGPWVEQAWTTGFVRLNFNLRLWLDKEWATRRPTYGADDPSKDDILLISYPNTLSTPDLFLNWVIFL